MIPCLCCFRFPFLLLQLAGRWWVESKSAKFTWKPHNCHAQQVPSFSNVTQMWKTQRSPFGSEYIIIYIYIHSCWVFHIYVNVYRKVKSPFSMVKSCSIPMFDVEKSLLLIVKSSQVPMFDTEILLFHIKSQLSNFSG